jgi:ATP-binding cassette subfamily B protein
MDSWSEADWFSRFRELADGRTAILITHRFTIAKRADIIHVMQAGKIVESGNHTDLLSKNGLYAESWISQTQMQSTTHSVGNVIDSMPDNRSEDRLTIG